MRVSSLTLLTLTTLAAWTLTDGISSAIAVAQQIANSTAPAGNSIYYYQDYQPPAPTSVTPPATASAAAPSFPAPSFSQPAKSTAPVSAQGSAPRPAIGAPDLAVTVLDLQVVGVEPALQELLRQNIQTQPGGTTSESQLQSDIAAILETGLFATATVSTVSTPNGLNVTYQVTPTLVRSLQLSGAQVLPLSVANQAFQNQLGQTVSPPLLQQGVQAVNQWYQQQGYTLARVLAVRPSPEGVITLEVAEGTIATVNIRFISPEGRATAPEGQPVQGRTQEAFIRRQIQLQPGQVFREDRARQDLQQLYQLGLFDRAEVALDGDATQVDLTYNLREIPSRNINLGGGYNDDSGIFGVITYRDQNIGGIGQQFATDVQLSRRDFQFNTNFVSPYRSTDPDVLGYRVDAFRRRGLSDTFDERILLPNGDRTREGRFGGGVTFTRPVEDWQASLGLNYTRISMRDAEGNLFATDARGNPLTLSGTGIDDLATVSLSVTRDQRNNPINPTQGSVLTLSSEQSIPLGLGNIFSNRLQANYVQYFPVQILRSGDTPEVIAINVQGGTFLGDIPPYNAFNLGGPTSVRGYNFGEISSGGSYLLTAAEYRFPIFTSPVTGVVFADFASDLGSAGAVPGQPALERGKPGSGFGYGAGVRVQSPIGVIRADYGFNNQGQGRLQLGIGQRF